MRLHFIVGLLHRRAVAVVVYCGASSRVFRLVLENLRLSHGIHVSRQVVSVRSNPLRISVRLLTIFGSSAHVTLLDLRTVESISLTLLQVVLTFYAHITQKLVRFSSLLVSEQLLRPQPLLFPQIGLPPILLFGSDFLKQKVCISSHMSSKLSACTPVSK